jgi:hypothetical protein
MAKQVSSGSPPYSGIPYESFFSAAALFFAIGEPLLGLLYLGSEKPSTHVHTAVTLYRVLPVKVRGFGPM